MEKIRYTPDCESVCPHSPDVHERHVSENGFASGWGMHFKPIADYWFDFHLHAKPEAGDNLLKLMQPDIEEASRHNVKGGMLLLHVHSPQWDGDTTDSLGYDEIGAATKEMVADGKYTWAVWPHYTNPDPGIIYAAKKAGAKGAKIHNAPVIQDAANPDLWLGSKWQATFQAMAECEMPVIWHVTQRLPPSPYTGGGRNTYWKEGWENGVTYGNEELLQVFLRCLERNPNVNFVGAHQLHIGWERLDALFSGYPNLYVDTTIGCQLKEWDIFYPADKAYLRQIFIKWADRIIYGTDDAWGKLPTNHHQLEHIRFVQQLDLPSDVLNKIAYGNGERLLKMK
ncbi:MAG: amidohydrolase family protein [Defluviitaleaceae bacterium]|nr:amidohydrolase family protein [Defluviitaleaceae bacterium]